MGGLSTVINLPQVEQPAPQTCGSFTFINGRYQENPDIHDVGSGRSRLHQSFKLFEEMVGVVVGQIVWRVQLKSSGSGDRALIRKRARGIGRTIRAVGARAENGGGPEAFERNCRRQHE